MLFFNPQIRSAGSGFLRLPQKFIQGFLAFRGRRLKQFELQGVILDRLRKCHTLIRRRRLRPPFAFAEDLRHLLGDLLAMLLFLLGGLFLGRFRECE